MEHFNKTILVRQDSQNDVESARIFDTESEAKAAMMVEFKEQKFAFSRSGYSINEEIGENYCWVEAECSDGPFSYVWSIMPGEVKSGFQSIALSKDEFGLLAHTVLDAISALTCGAKIAERNNDASGVEAFNKEAYKFDSILEKLTLAYIKE